MWQGQFWSHTSGYFRSHVFRLQTCLTTSLAMYWEVAFGDMCIDMSNKSKTISRGNNVKLVMHQISVDKIENPCY